MLAAVEESHTDFRPGPEGQGISDAALREKLFEGLVSADQVASVLEVDRSTVFRYMRDGKLPRVKWLGKTYTSWDGLKRYLQDEVDKATIAAEKRKKEVSRPRKRSVR